MVQYRTSLIFVVLSNPGSLFYPLMLQNKSRSVRFNLCAGLVVWSVSDSPLNSGLGQIIPCLQRTTGATLCFSIVQVYSFAFYQFLVQYFSF